ncbi:MAG: hypothetical protein JNK79_05015 [Chitinophagaceae bacterium]|nr:hypothetical protein [Chitinophagaceae bacterium]
MKNLVFSLFVILIFAACKKSSDNPTPPAGNYIKIDSDTRELGDVPGTDVSYVEADYPDGPLLAVGITKKVANIDGSKNEYLIMSIALFEGGVSNTEYKIENVANHSPSSSSITITLHGNEINAGMTGKAGKLYVTRDESNKIKSFKFENIQMDGTYEATVSCNVVVK